MPAEPLLLAANQRVGLPETLPRPDHTRLGETLVAQGTLTRAQLADALARQSREQAPLGEILASEGILSPMQVSRGLARSLGTITADFAASPPDERLAPQLEAAQSIEAKTVIWRKAGAVTLLACADPRRAAGLLRQLPRHLHPARLAMASEQEVDAAIARIYGPQLAHHAEHRTPAQQSCRDWSGLSLIVLSAALLAITLLAGPAALAALLFWTAVATLVTNTGLKLVCLFLALRQQQQRPRRTSRGLLPFPAQPAPLPKISVLVPLYKEERIASALIARLQALDYPKPLLEVCLITEADDALTRRALRQTDLPDGFRAVTVPTGTLKTKPRAMNYALDFTSGQIIGVYDAEDAPDPDQLRKVAEAFARGPNHLACVQGVLSFYNPRAGWLARCFSFEYAGWFRVMLPGLERLGFAIPLGGTTLFFRRDALLRLGGWDAHNVTEDADLGMRLARHGYTCQMIDTVTHEEANNRLWPWVRQRSRWLKGYAMTWCVHMRNPARLFSDLGAWKFIGFQLLFLGTLVSFALAPVLWWGLAHVLAPSTLPPPAGLRSEQIGFLTTVFLACEGVTLGLFLAASRRLRPRPGLVWVVTLPLYFMLATLAAYKGLLEMVRKPFYWDKTEHGVSPADGTLAIGARVDLQPRLEGHG